MIVDLPDKYPPEIYEYKENANFYAAPFEEKICWFSL